MEKCFWCEAEYDPEESEVLIGDLNFCTEGCCDDYLKEDPPDKEFWDMS